MNVAIGKMLGRGNPNTRRNLLRSRFVHHRTRTRAAAVWSQRLTAWAMVRSRSYFTTDSQSACLGIEHPCGTCDQILFLVGMLLSEICGLISMGSPLWREDGSANYGVITQWSESRRARNHTLLSHLRLPPNLEGQFPVFISSRNRVAQLYPRALCSLYVVSYDSPLTTHRATVEVI
jgi:hypothetical protein